MTDENTGATADTKPWYASKTIWGGLIAALAPLVALVGHYTIDPSVSDALACAFASVGGLVAVIGRAKANTTIAKKDPK